MSVSVKYKNKEITSLSETETKTLLTNGKYCEADIVLENTKDGIDTSDATAVAGDIKSGKTAYVKGAKVTGSLQDVEPENPDIIVSASGLITAEYELEAGIVSAGIKSSTKQMATQAGTTIIPGTSGTIAVRAHRYTTGVVRVAGDKNLVSENIKKGVSIFDVEGTLESSADETWVLNENVNFNAWYTKYSQDSVPVSFVSNGLTYSSMRLYNQGGMSFFYDDNAVATLVSETVTDWENPNSRKITFIGGTPQDIIDNLLILADGTVNAVKQPSDYAIQPDKSITITANGTTSITPDSPYNAMDKVDVTVNVASGGGVGHTVTISNETALSRDDYLHFLKANATVVFFGGSTAYTIPANTVIEDVIGFMFLPGDSYWALDLTLSSGSGVYTEGLSLMEVSAAIVTAPNSATYIEGARRFCAFYPTTDVTISKLEIVNTD